MEEADQPGEDFCPIFAVNLQRRKKLCDLFRVFDLFRYHKHDRIIGNA